jgi:hypothetical protein
MIFSGNQMEFTMKAKAVLIKRSTVLSVFLVGAVIAFCSATNVRADPIPLEVQAKIV